MSLSNFFIPPRYGFLKETFGSQKFTMLDVGCGHLSFGTVRHHLPNAIYHGVDKRWQGDLAQYQQMDRFFDLELDSDTLDSIPNNTYDAIVFSHTIEHLFNGDKVLKRLVPKLKIGGYIYVEFPSLRSLYLPSADGTLNFFDDPTHIRIFDVKEVANLLLAENVRVLKVGKARNRWKLVLTTPLILAYNALYFLAKQRLSARGMNEILGFADFVLGVRHEIPHDKRLGSWEATSTALSDARDN